MKQSEFLKTVMPFKDKVFRVAKRLLVSTEEAEDATQELLFKKHSERNASEGASYHYGYGFSIIQQGSAINIGHGGVFPGVGSRFEYYPQ